MLWLLEIYKLSKKIALKVVFFFWSKNIVVEILCAVFYDSYISEKTSGIPMEGRYAFGIINIWIWHL